MTKTATSKRPAGNGWAKRRAKTLQSISKQSDKFRSKFEAKLAEQVEAAGVAVEYETDRFEYHVTRHYTPDLKLPCGAYIEIKGYMLACDRSKHLKIKKQHPELDIRFVFQTPHKKLSKTSNTTYAMWAEKHGFRWAAKEIPAAWLAE